MHLVPFLHEVTGSCESGRAAAHNGNFLSCGCCPLDVLDVEVLLLVVGNEAFEISDAQ
jgi:hypothetical protein